MAPVRSKKAVALKALQALPNVGPSVALDLYALGFRQPAELRGCDPRAMYDTLRLRAGGKMDRCLLYTFRAVKYYVEAKRPDPARVPWWKWSDEALRRI